MDIVLLLFDVKDYFPQLHQPVITGLVPVISLRDARCPPKRDGRDIRAITPVFDGLCPAMT
jgi:hypothetical protein